MRAVNVAGTGRAPMASVVAMLNTLGVTHARSLLQSGNLVFEDRGRSAEALETALQAETLKRLKLATEYFVRAPKDWQRMVDGNPFRAQAVSDPARMHVFFLKTTPAPDAIVALRHAIDGPEIIEPAAGPHLYAYYPDGMGQSKLTNAKIEKYLGSLSTARNWNTVLKVDAAGNASP
jgi:uncharacterized protein (DUF1697 family)